VNFDMPTIVSGWNGYVFAGDTVRKLMVTAALDEPPRKSHDWAKETDGKTKIDIVKSKWMSC